MLRRALATEDEHDAVVDRAAAVFISDVVRRREGQCETGRQAKSFWLSIAKKTACAEASIWGK
tara:strand:+ start:2541 stop:2729 length:189 start_codon:yes stop_codon:yes gene_type:complete